MLTNKRNMIEDCLGIDYQELHVYATKRVGQQDAGDIVQEAYLHLLQRDNREVIREPRAFLFRIVANLSIDSWRQAKRHGDFSIADTDFDLNTLSCPMPGPEAVIDGNLQFEGFLSLLDELSEIQRHAFILNRVEGLTHVMIAQRLGVSTKSVQRYLVNAMEHFASRLDTFTP
jgi:RNA polymerase sigma-70 factor (ECF subfamily)